MALEFATLPSTEQLEVGAMVRAVLSPRLMENKGWKTRTVEGVISAVSAKAIQLSDVHVCTVASDNCHRCGRDIKQFGSRKIGYGPDCAEHLGIAHPGHARELTDAEADAIRARIYADVVLGTTWIPRWCKFQVLRAAPPQTDTAGQVVPDVYLRVEELSTRKNHGTYIVARTKFLHKDRCKVVTGARWDPDVPAYPEGGRYGAWVYQAHPRIAHELKKAFDGLVRRGNAAFVSLCAQLDEAALDAATAKKSDYTLPDIPGMAHSAWMHQRQAYYFALEQEAVMLSMDMGTGKSYVTVALILNRQHQNTLILAPKKVVESVWRGQFEQHAPVPPRICCLYNGGTAKDKAELAEIEMRLARKEKRQFVCVVNYETAWREDFAEWALGAGFDCVVYDESHKIKSPTGKAAVFCGRLAKRIRYKIALTGTPMPHSPLDAWSQYRALDTSIFGTSFVQFKNRYAVMGGFMNKQVKGWQRLDELNQKFYQIAYRVTKDVLDLPPVQHITHTCKLGKSALAIYKGLEDDFIADVEEGKVTAANALARLLRLQQITSGFAVREDRVIQDVDTAKIEVVEDLLDALAPTEPVVIFARFRHDLDNLQALTEKMGRRFAELSGRTNATAATLQDWTEGKADVIGVQIQAGGVGIDLTRAHYCIYYSLGFSLGDYEQSLARVHRPGQTQPTFYYHVLAEGTVDQKVYRALSDRKSVVEGVLTMFGKE